jgi:thiol-disulfide isomerase/thioredoxin
MALLCAGGRPVVLVFGNPTCGPCREIFANLRRWQASLAGSLRIAVISFGDADATRSLSDEFGVNDVLLDIDGEAWRAYGMPGNPAAATIAPDGTIVTAPVVGQDAIEELIRLVLRSDDSNAEPWKPTIHAA